MCAYVNVRIINYHTIVCSVYTVYVGAYRFVFGTISTAVEVGSYLGLKNSLENITLNVKLDNFKLSSNIMYVMKLKC